MRSNSLLWLLILATLMACTLWVEESKQNRIDHDGSIGRSARMVYVDLLNAETGQRGFLITGEEKYLDSYDQGSAAYAADIGKLEQAFGEDDPKLQQVEADGRCKLNELAKSIKIMREEGFKAAQQEVMGDKGRNCMKDAQSVLSDLYNRMSTDINATKADLRHKLKLAEYGLVGALGLSFGSLMFSGLRLRRNRRSSLEPGN